MSYSPFAHLKSIAWRAAPIQATLFLTRRCNLRCPFCFYRSQEGDRACREEELSLAELKRISDSMGSLLWLAFSGGEIFLRRDLSAIAELFYRRNKPAMILLPTNGQLPETIREETEAILKTCPKSTVVVKLSLDGLEDVHDSLRGKTGAFRKTLETYQALAPLLKTHDNFELGVNTVFCAANQERMDEVIDYVDRLDAVCTHTVSLIRGEVDDPAMKVIDIEKYRRTIVRLEQRLKENGSATYRFRGGRLKAAQDILQRRRIYETYLTQRRRMPCLAGKLTVVVTEGGDVYPCEAFGQKMGNVREAGYNIRRILGSAAGRGILHTIEASRCHCTHECYTMMNILFNPLQYPALLNEYRAMAPRSRPRTA
jgi:radical SAM protein with 4Fe4S-binding SPASM domain